MSVRMWGDEEVNYVHVVLLCHICRIINTVKKPFDLLGGWKFCWGQECWPCDLFVCTFSEEPHGEL